MTKTNLIRLAIANSIVEKLWIMGLLNDEERVNILEKNKNSFPIC